MTMKRPHPSSPHIKRTTLCSTFDAATRSCNLRVLVDLPHFPRSSSQVSMKSEGLCSKLTVPSELLDRTDVFIFDCDGVIVSDSEPRVKYPP